MLTRTPLLVRSLGIVPILLCVVCFLSHAEAQHGGGGGGHSGGGHSGSGHSSGGHSSGKQTTGARAGGHFGWLRFGFGKHSARHEVGASSASDISSHQASRLWNITTPVRRPSIPPTLIWSSPLFSAHRDGRVSFESSPLRHHRTFFNHRFPRFSSSGCFFNGMSQVCFFEPFFPLLCFSGGFDSGFGFGADAPDPGDSFGSQGSAQWEMSAIPPPANPSDDTTAESNSPVHRGLTPSLSADQPDLGQGVFLLVLNNGASRAVVDYWVADGYLEYVSPDGTRSHIPLEALDLQNTVSQNAPRGLPFVLRSAPAPNP